jgi:hypothetical protein
MGLTLCLEKVTWIAAIILRTQIFILIWPAGAYCAAARRARPDASCAGVSCRNIFGFNRGLSGSNICLDGAISRVFTLGRTRAKMEGGMSKLWCSIASDAFEVP